MEAVQTEADRGCRGVLLWLAVIAGTFAVCVTVGVVIFALNVRDWGGDMVRSDLFPLIEAAQLPESEKASLRTRVDGLIEAYRAGDLPKDDFIAQALALREELATKQPPPPPPETPGVPEGGAERHGAGSR